MSKKMMLLALTVVSAAMVALPAMASAQSAHLDATTTFTVHAGAGSLKTTGGSTVNCTTTTGSGSFTTTTAGTVSLTFHGCKNNLGLNCTTGTDTTGTITAANLPFHLIMVNANKPGVLITSPAGGEEVTPGKRLFSDFACFGVTVKVFGAGIIGTLENACDETTTTGKLLFTSTSHGQQEDKLYTGNTFDLESKIGSGAHETSSIDATATLTFPAARKLICTA